MRSRDARIGEPWGMTLPALRLTVAFLSPAFSIRADLVQSIVINTEMVGQFM